MAKLGYKLKTTDGKNEVALYPSEQVRVTQGYGGTYSHEGTLNLDNAGNTASTKIPAPFKMKVIQNSGSGYGIVIYHSIDKVWTPSGLQHVTMVLMHDNDASRWNVGRIFQQGEHCYDEGDADPSGLTTGIHVHMEFALGHETDRIQTGGRFHIRNQVKVEKAVFINGSEFINSNLDAPATETPVFTEYKGIDPELPDEPEKRKDDIMMLYMMNVIKGNFS